MEQNEENKLTTSKLTYKKQYTKEELYNIYTSKIKDRLEEIQLMLFSGYSFSQIAKELGISNSLLWKIRITREFSELRDAFSAENLQYENVENALYRKCIGYSYVEEQPIKVKKEYYNKKGKKCVEETIRNIEVVKYCPPDFQAIRFYLLNHGNKYHSETQPPKDDTLDNAIKNANDILVKVRNLADNDERNDD